MPASEISLGAIRSGIGRISQRGDMAALALIFTFGALINACGMVSPVYALQSWLAAGLNIASEAAVLGIIFGVGLIVEPIVLLAAAALTRRWARLSESLLAIVTRWAYALIPLGFGVWLARYGFHFLTGAWTVVPVLQSLVADLDLPLFGAPRWDLGALVPERQIFPIQFGLIGLGAMGSLLVAWELAATSAPDRRRAAFAPWAVLILVMALAAAWLMLQPMEMRGVSIGG